MRWRLLDRIDRFEPWAAASGRKAISFEECCLLEPFGRKGEFPAALVLQSGVELVRALVARSSEFAETCMLEEAGGFAFSPCAAMGGVLTVAARIVERDERSVTAECRATCSGVVVGEGRLQMRLLSMVDPREREATEGAWQELYGAT